MTLSQALQNMMWLSLPVAGYACTVRWRYALASSEILNRLGLTGGNPRAYLIALATAMPLSVVTFWITSWTSNFKGSAIAPFVGASPTPEIIARAFYYGLFATGFPEELLFRGLIAGALFRRFTLWKANLGQAAIFLIPHLIILVVAPRLWPLVIFAPLVLGMAAGWLRHTSGSIWPAVIIHGVPNAVGALGVMNWRR